MAFFVLVAHAAAAPSEVEITFPTSDGLTLAGTLTVPDGQGPFAAAVLVGGFGPTNRNGSFGLLGRSDYDGWAHRLARRGVAILRYDPGPRTLSSRPSSAAMIAWVRGEPE